ncbi:MAG TPA: serine hydrolase domain-containing protein [Acidimicrobiales bacterium]
MIVIGLLTGGTAAAWFVLRQTDREAVEAPASPVGRSVPRTSQTPQMFHDPSSLESLTREIDQVVPASLLRFVVPGATVALVHGGEVIWTHGYGVADAATGVPMQPDAVFQVGSTSKAIAAYTVLGTVGEGRLSLDTPVEGATAPWRLPPSEPGREADHDAVTLRRLLSHTRD